MPRATCVVAVLFPLFLALPLTARAEDPGDAAGIAWQKDLPSGLAKAKETGRPLMICINAKFVEGSTKEERAAKGLREVVYKDPRIVEKSREFVCVLLTPESSNADYSELGALGIGGQIVSPQHIFVNSEGTEVVARREYWSYGQGEPAVEALLALMEKAQGKAATADGEAAGSEGAAAGPTEGQDRATWIAEMIALVKDDIEERKRALRALIAADQDGDCTKALINLLEDNRKDQGLAEALIRALGRDGLEAAAIPISEFLTHKEPTVRANAAVSLEYIGSHDKKVVTALLTAAGNQKDEAVANHMYRALGRCGTKDSRALGLLLKMAASGKSEFATYGPAIGLAYVETDEKAARGVEQILKQIGVPGGRRGGGQNAIKRGVVAWTLASIGSEKSANFVREELLVPLENMKAFWVEGLRNFFEAVAQKCAGDESKMAEIEGGVQVIVGFARGFGAGPNAPEPKSLMDESRTGREPQDFQPKGENLLTAGD
jgi:hypothetical protein